MSNRKDGTLYVGVTGDLIRRANQHRQKRTPGFTKRYNLDKLVYFECHTAPRLAIQREKNIKHWNRAWKVNLIENQNPDWEDLYDGIATN